MKTHSITDYRRYESYGDSYFKKLLSIASVALPSALFSFLPMYDGSLDQEEMRDRTVKLLILVPAISFFAWKKGLIKSPRKVNSLILTNLSFQAHTIAMLSDVGLWGAAGAAIVTGTITGMAQRFLYGRS